MLDNCHTQLAAILAQIDQLLAEEEKVAAESDGEERDRALQRLLAFQHAARRLEAMLSGE